MNAQDFFERYKWKGAKDSIGSGGFGKVFRVEDTLRNRKVAIKNSFVDSHKFTLKREVELVNELEPHLNVLRYENYYRFDINNEMMDYAIMPFYEHGNLSNVIKSRALNDAEKQQITDGIVNAMLHLHNNKIVHRDLKPSNILMDFRNGNWVPKIADFGLSRFKTDIEKSVSNSSVGRSMPYAAPEQLENGGKVNLHTDIWALGAVLYELYTGKRAFQSDNSKTSSADVQLYHKIVEVSLPDDINQLPYPVNNIIAGCLIRDGKKRLTIERIANLLEGVASPEDAVTLLMNEEERIVSPPLYVNETETNLMSGFAIKRSWIVSAVAFVVACFVIFWWQQDDKSEADTKLAEMPAIITEPTDVENSTEEKNQTPPKEKTALVAQKKSPVKIPPKKSFSKIETEIIEPKPAASDEPDLPQVDVSSTVSNTALSPIEVEVKTNKGKRGIQFSEGEEMKLYFRVNATGFVRFVYRLADGNLVLLHNDYKVTESQVDKWIQVGKSFTCSPPFGAEEVIVFTSTEHFNSLKTRYEDGYTFIEEGLSAVISKSKSRGMKAKRDPVISTKSMNIITKGKS